MRSDSTRTAGARPRTPGSPRTSSNERSERRRELIGCSILCQYVGGVHDGGGNPVGEGNLVHDMPATGGVLLVELSEATASDPIRQPHDGRPKPAVNERDLAVDEAGHEDVGGVAESARCEKDLVPGWVAPPTASDRFSGDEFGDARERSMGRLQQDAVLFQQPVEVHNRTLQ